MICSECKKELKQAWTIDGVIYCFTHASVHKKARSMILVPKKRRLVGTQDIEEL